MLRSTKILTLSLPAKMAKEAEKIAKEESRTRSELFREALRFYIDSKQWRAIRGWGEQAAAKQNLKPEDVERLISEVRSDG
jgi:CopG family transcriptional regulator/antitoxin EndoAI